MNFHFRCTTDTLGGSGWSPPLPGHFTPREIDPVRLVEEAGWTPGTVWTSAENLAATGIRSPDRPSLSESPYRQSYFWLIRCTVCTHRSMVPVRQTAALQHSVHLPVNSGVCLRTRDPLQSRVVSLLCCTAVGAL